MIKTWEDLSFWDSGEWQVIEDSLNDMDLVETKYTPRREHLFDALYATPFDKCKVMFMGQDPYPSVVHATGLAFSVPKAVKVLPPSLNTIFDEYESDLHYPRPMTGDLNDWAKEGVLLWNSIPLFDPLRPISHALPEWKSLTDEVISNLREKGIVFVFVGSHAKKFVSSVKDWSNCRHLTVDHPSPRAMLAGKHPFKGSRIFSSTNALLSDIGLEPVDWKLLCRPKRTIKLKGKLKRVPGSNSDTVSS